MNAPAPAAKQNGGQNLPAIRGPRLPYHPAVEERFGIDRASWKALVEAIFPSAQSTESVILALSYCKARRLDPFKRCVHIVGVWDSKHKRMVDTVWPGIGELRTTATRTGVYAGLGKTEFGPMITREFRPANRQPFTMTFPEWAQVTVKRMVQGREVSFEGPMVFWEETFASARDGCPNSMWKNRPRGQIAKCAEAAALRAAFPEELGDMWSDEEAGGWVAKHGVPAGGVINHKPNGGAKGQLESFAGAQPAALEHQQTADPVQDQLDDAAGEDDAVAVDAHQDTGDREAAQATPADDGPPWDDASPHDPETGEVLDGGHPDAGELVDAAEAPPADPDLTIPLPESGDWRGLYKAVSERVEACQTASELRAFMDANAVAIGAIAEHLKTWHRTLEGKITKKLKELPE